MNADRRQHARLTVSRPAKVYIPRVNQFVPGATRDVSRSGVMIEVRSPRPLNIGDTLDIGVAWTREAVLSSSRMMHGRVVRVESRSNGQQSLGVEFVQEQAARLAA